MTTEDLIPVKVQGSSLNESLHGNLKNVFSFTSLIFFKEEIELFLLKAKLFYVQSVPYLFTKTQIVKSDRRRQYVPASYYYRDHVPLRVCEKETLPASKIKIIPPTTSHTTPSTDNTKLLHKQFYEKKEVPMNKHLTEIIGCHLPIIWQKFIDSSAQIPQEV